MEGIQRSMDKRPSSPTGIDPAEVGHANVVPINPGPRSRVAERYVNPDLSPENANIRRLVLSVEAITQETLSVEELVSAVDMVFAGANGPEFPVVTYNFIEVDGEPYDEPE
jgi:hypothetical protein